MIHNTVIKDKTPGNTTIDFYLAPPIALISLDNVTLPNTQKLSFQYKAFLFLDYLIQKIKTHGNKCKDAKPCIIQACDASKCIEIHQFSGSQSTSAETAFSGSHSTGAETAINNTFWITIILISFFTKCCYS